MGKYIREKVRQRRWMGGGSYHFPSWITRWLKKREPKRSQNSDKIGV